MPSGFISTSSGFMGARSASEALSLKGVEDRPWKERDQSTGLSFEATGCGSGIGPSVEGGGRSLRPEERERWFEAEVILLGDVEVGGEAGVL